MSMIVDYLSWGIITAGCFFIIVGPIGLLRMPDLYTRLHAASVVDNLGVPLLFIGLMLQSGFTLVTLKLLILIVLLFFTTPVGGHALARAALHRVAPLLSSKEDVSSKQ